MLPLTRGRHLLDPGMQRVELHAVPRTVAIPVGALAALRPGAPAEESGEDHDVLPWPTMVTGTVGGPDATYVSPAASAGTETITGSTYAASTTSAPSCSS